VAQRLYEEARLIADPEAFETERAKRIQEKIDKERQSRIRDSKKVKVNQALVEKIMKRQSNRDKVDEGAGVLGDDRFKVLFEDEEFAVDETSREFRELNPSTNVQGNPEESPQIDMRISTSGYKNSSKRNLKEPKTGNVLGEKSMTFTPAKKENAAAAVEKKGRRDKGRRSASGNTFRRM
jgi:ribosome biogenesis protein ENP2